MHFLRNGDLPQSADCVTHTHTHRPLRAMCYFGYSLLLEDINNDCRWQSLICSRDPHVVLRFFFLLETVQVFSVAVVFVRLSVFVLSMSAAVVDAISSCGPSVPVRIVSGVGCVVCGSSVCVWICLFSFPS